MAAYPWRRRQDGTETPWFGRIGPGCYEWRPAEGIVYRIDRDMVGDWLVRYPTVTPGRYRRRLLSEVRVLVAEHWRSR